MRRYSDKHSFSGSKLGRLRAEKGFTQCALAEVCGIDQRQLSRYELDVHAPIKRNLTKLSVALGVDESFFFEYRITT